jgi:hypothetical protein
MESRLVPKKLRYKFIDIHSLKHSLRGRAGEKRRIIIKLPGCFPRRAIYCRIQTDS